ncbi:hypothetical protein [Desulfosporosinus sp. FKB]|uniref:hypothetical protein n=1 Tax=Desulfosporosinus sp. FKB TaxID=1969835 RepID=UPI000B4A3A35|nr:hypothetical protein [Desulfosporosinus sp. FKB]
MITLIKMELRNCLNRKQFKVMFIVLLLLVIYSFINTGLIVKGMSLSGLRSGYEMSILQHPYGQAILMTILFVLPLFANIIYSDSYIIDVKSGIYIYITTRSKKNVYIISKAIAVVVSTFITFYVPLVINVILSIITFPSISYETNGVPPYIIEYNPEELLNWLRIQNPLVFSLVAIAIISLFASLYALLGYAISLNFGRNGLIPIAFVMLAYLVIDTFISLLPNGFHYQLTNLALPTTTVSASYFFLCIFVILLLSVILLLRQLYIVSENI